MFRGLSCLVILFNSSFSSCMECVVLLVMLHQSRQDGKQQSFECWGIQTDIKHVSLVENAHSESFTFIVEDFIITSNKDFIQVFSILIALHHEFILLYATNSVTLATYDFRQKVWDKGEMNMSCFVLSNSLNIVENYL